MLDWFKSLWSRRDASCSGFREKNGSNVIDEPAVYVGQVYYGEASRYLVLRYLAEGRDTYRLQIIDRNHATDEFAFNSWALVERIGTGERRWVPVKKGRWVNPREPKGLFDEIRLGALRLGEEGWRGYPVD